MTFAVLIFDRLDLRIEEKFGFFNIIKKRKKMGYIGAHGLAALHRHEYSGVDHCYLAKYVLQPFWNCFVKIFPLWMP